MPKLYNTVTQKWMFMPDSYVGKYPFQTEAEVAAPASAPEPVVEEVKPKKKRKAEYIHPTFDADGDGLVQDGTIFERPEGVELSPEEVTSILEEADKE